MVVVFLCDYAPSPSSHMPSVGRITQVSVGSFVTLGVTSGYGQDASSLLAPQTGANPNGRLPTWRQSSQ